MGNSILAAIAVNVSIYVCSAIRNMLSACCKNS